MCTKKHFHKLQADLIIIRKISRKCDHKFNKYKDRLELRSYKCPMCSINNNEVYHLTSQPKRV